MLKTAIDFGKQILALTRDTQQNKEDVKSLRQEFQDLRRENSQLRQENVELRQEFHQMRLDFAALTHIVEVLRLELHYTKDSADSERKNTRNELELELLRFKTSLPPGEDRSAALEQENEALKQQIAKLTKRLEEIEK